MLSFLLNRWLKPDNQPKKSANIQPLISIEKHVKENVRKIRQMLHSPSDLVIREIQIGEAKHPCAVVCIDGLVDKQLVNEHLLTHLMIDLPLYDVQAGTNAGEAILLFLQQEALPVQEIETATSLDEAVQAILSGDTVLFVDGTDQSLIIDSKGWKSRAVEEPQTEAVVRGPRDGFVEDIRTNLALIRRKIVDPNLRFDSFTIGRRAKREVIVAYLDGVVNPALVKETKRRISTIDVDEPVGSGFIELWISDTVLSPFPVIMTTERPDKIAGAILQGRVAVIVDGTPFQLILPIALASNFQTSEDYYQHWLVATSIRFLRLIAAFIAAFLPALYISLVEYHHGLIPSKLAYSIAGAREGVPFPAVVEAFMMEMTLEILREAGVRLPKPIGQTIGIVGGLVIGEAAVSAGIVSPIMVIVVAITAISSFALPSYTFASSLRLVRFLIMLVAAIFGLYGVILAYIMINIHLVNLTSFGLPYSAPYSPQILSDWKDLILRSPATEMDKRPKMLQTKDTNRMQK